MPNTCRSWAAIPFNPAEKENAPATATTVAFFKPVGKVPQKEPKKKAGKEPKKQLQTQPKQTQSKRKRKASDACDAATVVTFSSTSTAPPPTTQPGKQLKKKRKLNNNGVAKVKVVTVPELAKKQRIQYFVKLGISVVHPYVLDLIQLVLNSSYNALGDRHPNECDISLLEKPHLQYCEMQEEETDRERAIRVQLRHRMLTAKAVNMPVVEFSRKLLEIWGCQLTETVVEIAPPPPQPMPKQAIVKPTVSAVAIVENDEEEEEGSGSDSDDEVEVGTDDDKSPDEGHMGKLEPVVEPAVVVDEEEIRFSEGEDDEELQFEDIQLLQQLTTIPMDDDDDDNALKPEPQNTSGRKRKRNPKYGTPPSSPPRPTMTTTPNSRQPLPASKQLTVRRPKSSFKSKASSVKRKPAAKKSKKKALAPKPKSIAPINTAVAPQQTTNLSNLITPTNDSKVMELLQRPQNNGRTFSWAERMDQLQAYKDEFGHLKFPSNKNHQLYSLGLWLAAQKSLHKKGKLRKERVADLRALECPWI